MIMSAVMVQMLTKGIELALATYIVWKKHNS